MKEKTFNIRKTIIRTLAVLLVLFGIWNGLWLFYRQYYFVRVAKQAELTEKRGNFGNASYQKEITLPDGITARYNIYCPSYLRFGHNYSASEEHTVGRIEQNGKWIYPDDYRITLSVHPVLFGKPRYQIHIYDQKTANEQYLNGEVNELTSGNSYIFDVDEDMNILREWSYGGNTVWNDAYDDTYAIFTRAKEVFGL
ncbi:MAG: hypothetical protein K2K02_04900 [Ruminococcus sp.]|nr:hypothetical protein [Ruminococcus sp.]